MEPAAGSGGCARGRGPRPAIAIEVLLGRRAGSVAWSGSAEEDDYAEENRSSKENHGSRRAAAASWSPLGASSKPNDQPCKKTFEGSEEVKLSPPPRYGGRWRGGLYVAAARAPTLPGATNAAVDTHCSPETHRNNVSIRRGRRSATPSRGVLLGGRSTSCRDLWSLSGSSSATPDERFGRCVQL